MSAELSVVSYYRKPDEKYHFDFWHKHMGKRLVPMLGECDLVEVTGDYNVKSGFFDIAYCQPWFVPLRRPARFIFSALSDYRGHENQIASWMGRVRPNLLMCFQQKPDELVEFGRRIGCLVELMPWFVTEFPPDCEKTIDVMSSGCTDPYIYPSRSRIFHHLKSKKISERRVLSGSDHFGAYPLSKEQYLDSVSRAKYYASGGIWDLWIPPKYYEVMNYGACLLSFGLPNMEECGFVDGDTFIQLRSVNDIDAIIDTDIYKEVGRRGQEMVRTRHCASARAKRILEIYHDFK